MTDIEIIINDNVYHILDLNRVPLISKMVNMNYDNIKVHKEDDKISFNIDFSDTVVQDYINIINTYTVIDNNTHIISLSDEMLDLMLYMGHSVDDVIYGYDEEYRYDLLLPRWEERVSNYNSIFSPFNVYVQLIHNDVCNIYCTSHSERERLLNSFPHKITSDNSTVIEHDHKDYRVHEKIFNNIEDMLYAAYRVSETYMKLNKTVDTQRRREYRINTLYNIVDVRRLTCKYVMSIIRNACYIKLPNINISEEDIRDYVINVYDEKAKERTRYPYVGDRMLMNEYYEKRFIDVCDDIGIDYDRDKFHTYMKENQLPHEYERELIMMTTDNFISDIEHFIYTYKKIDCVMLHKALRELISSGTDFINYIFYEHKFNTDEKTMLIMLIIKSRYNIRYVRCTPTS